jgi:Flp pilus assembly protein TadD
MLTLGGCSALKSTNESIVRVQTPQHTVRAARLTEAGIAALNHGKFARGEQKFRAAIDADPRYGPARNNLGLLRYEQGDLYQAITAFQRAGELMPDNPAVRYNLALALESAGRPEEALPLYAAAHEIDPTNPNYLGNLTRLRSRMGLRDDLLRQQLRDLLVIETRPEWKRWADRQLALTLNPVLDRGPVTPDLESTINRSRQAEASSLRDKIIDLTPVAPVAAELPDPPQAAFETLPEALQTTRPQPPRAVDRPLDLTPPAQALPGESSAADEPSPRSGKPVLQEQEIEDLSVEDYYRAE